MTKVKAGSTSYSPMHWGVVAGYNHFLSSSFSLGGEASYMAVSEKDAHDSFGLLNFIATAKLWF